MTGIVNLDKPAGMTSFGACAAVRRLTGEKKCGHGGTLDPEATGVLPVLLGKATRLSDVFLGLHKTYEARLRFGTSYDTGDIWGKEIGAADKDQDLRLAHLTREEVETAAADFVGNVVQIPPAFSALKIGGVPAYKLARRGEAPELRPRKVNIYSIVVGGFSGGPDGPEAALTVECGRGTYIRTLCCDIAASLGLPGAMASLRRTSYGPLSIGDSVTPDRLTGDSFILPCDTILGGYPAVRLTATEADDYRFGRLFKVDIPDAELVRVYAEDILQGLGSVKDGQLRGRINLL
ncbi:MAG: tRNA pseudouridine(55) synthase TruB [Clostridia bacterium]|nr:tRNA pseudouridine(55) synthase TruB [Clostridia bacterium]